MTAIKIREDAVKGAPGMALPQPQAVSIGQSRSVTTVKHTAGGDQAV